MPLAFKILLPPKNNDSEPSLFEIKELKKNIFTFKSKDELAEFTLSSSDWLKENSRTSERLYTEIIKSLESLKNIRTSNNNSKWEEYKNIDMAGQGDVELIHNWKNTYSIDDLKKMVEDKGYSAISIGDFPFAALKKFDYQLEKEHCHPTEGYTNTFLIYKPNISKTEDDDTNQGGYWTEYHGIDMNDQGDVDIISEWRKNTTMDELKKKVEKNNWSAISVSPFDKSYSHAALKNFEYQLTPEHCEEQEYEVTLYIYHRPGKKSKKDEDKSIVLDKFKAIAEKYSEDFDDLSKWNDGLRWIFNREKRGKLDEIAKFYLQYNKDDTPEFRENLYKVLNAEDGIFKKKIKEKVKDFVNDSNNANNEFVIEYFKGDMVPSVEVGVFRITNAVRALANWKDEEQKWFLEGCNKIDDLWERATAMMEDNTELQGTYLMRKQDQQRAVGLLMQEGSDFLKVAKENYEKLTGKEWNPEKFINAPDAG